MLFHSLLWNPSCCDATCPCALWCICSCLPLRPAVILDLVWNILSGLFSKASAVLIYCKSVISVILSEPLESLVVNRFCQLMLINVYTPSDNVDAFWWLFFYAHSANIEACWHSVLLEGVTLAGKHDGKKTNRKAKKMQVSLRAITFAFM